MYLHYLVKQQYRKTSENLMHASTSTTNIVVVATCLRCGGLISNHFNTDLLLSLLVKNILKSVNIWRSYSKKWLTDSLALCKSILLQYLFFCVAAHAYSHTVGILVWPHCVLFSQW